MVLTDGLVFEPLLTNFVSDNCDIKKACPIYPDDPQILKRLQPSGNIWSDAAGRVVSSWFSHCPDTSGQVCFTLKPDFRACRFVVDQHNVSVPHMRVVNGVAYSISAKPCHDQPWIKYDVPEENGELTFAMYNACTGNCDVVRNEKGYPIVSALLAPSGSYTVITNGQRTSYHSFVAYALDLRPTPFNFGAQKSFNEWWTMLCNETFTWMPQLRRADVVEKLHTLTVSGWKLLAVLRRCCASLTAEVQMMILSKIPHGHIPLIENTLVNVGTIQLQESFVFKPFQVTKIKEHFESEHHRKAQKVEAYFVTFDFVQPIGEDDPGQPKNLRPFVSIPHFYDSYRQPPPSTSSTTVINNLPL